MSHGPVHYDGDRLESLLFNPIDRPEVGNMLSSYRARSRLKFCISSANNGDVFSIMHINARSLLKSLDKLKLIMMNMQTPLPLLVSRKLG